MITATIASLIFYFLPTFLGRPVVKLLYRKSLSYPFVSYFTLGSIILYVTMLIFYALKPFIPILFDFTLLQEIVVFILFILLPLNFIVGKDDINFKKYILPAVFSLSLGMLAYVIWQFKSPYSFDWDMFEHQTLINEIVNGKISIVLSRLSDTFGFNGYSTIFHSLVASSQAFFNLSFLQYWTAISGIHLFFVIFASYLLAQEITGNKLTAYIAACITALVFDSSISFTTMFFMPQTFTALLFALIFTQLISEIKNGRLPTLSILIIQALFIFINHYIVGFVAGGFYLLSYTYIKFSTTIEKAIHTKHLITGLMFVALIGILFSSHIPLGFINSGEAQDYSLNLINKFNIMKQSYGYLILLLLPVGIWATITSGKKIPLFSLIITLLLLSIVLIQIPYAIKFFTLARFFIDVFIAIGIYYLIKPMNNLFKGLSFTVLIVVLSAMLIINASMWKGILRYQNIFTQISTQELQAGEFLRQAYAGSDSLIISDPATQNILEPISSVNSQGGAYMDFKTRKILDAISKITNPAEIASGLYSIHDKINTVSSKRLLVLTGRYFAWQNSTPAQKQVFSYNIWAPKELTLENIAIIDRLLSDPAHFQTVYRNTEVVILEVKE